jgi:ribose transport system ATP-binding protein
MLAKTSAVPPVAEMLSVTGVSKSFQGQQALRDVSLSVQRGEVHCLLGQNGSGKSTLIKILAGFHASDAYESAVVVGKPLALGNAAAAHQLGLRFIHQDRALIDSLPVFENLELGGDYDARFWLSDRKARNSARDAFRKYGVDIDPGALLGSLGSTQQVITAIVRALHHGDAASGLLVLDEATASLPEQDKEHLFSLLRDIRSRGGTILYVTHRLREVFEIGDRVTVLRNGRVVGTREVAELDYNGLVGMILGQSLESFYPDPPTPGTGRALEVIGIRGHIVKDASVTVHKGEIVGVVGLMGSGVDEFAHLIFGSSWRARGDVRVNGKAIRANSPYEAIRGGMALVPGDRKRLGGVPAWTVAENITLPRPPRRGLLRWLSPRKEAQSVVPLLDRFDVVPKNPSARFSSLSGGNQQKVMITRWMRTGASVYVMEEPTAGVDVGAKATIYAAMNEVAASGAALLLVTSDFDEAAYICDRIIVLRNGEIGATLSGDRLTADLILAEVLKGADV